MRSPLSCLVLSARRRSRCAAAGGFGLRLERVPDDALPKRRIAWDAEKRSPEFRLTMSSAGVIDNLLLREMSPRAALDGEVLVEVHAVGLNFRDVMAATGLLPAEAEVGLAWERLGFECSGVVRQVGAGVDPALIGKRVVAVTSGALRLAGRSAGGAGVRDPGKLHVRAGRRDPDLLCDRAVRAGNARPDPEGREGSHSCGDRRRRSRRDLGRQASRRGDLCDGRQRREARLSAQARRPAHLRFPLARFCRRRAWPRPTATASIWC